MTAKNSIEQAILPGVEAGELAGAAALVRRNGAARGPYRPAGPRASMLTPLYIWCRW